MQGCVISCGTVVFFQKSRNLSRSLLTNNNFYCVYGMPIFNKVKCQQNLENQSAIQFDYLLTGQKIFLHEQSHAAFARDL